MCGNFGLNWTILPRHNVQATKAVACASKIAFTGRPNVVKSLWQISTGSNVVLPAPKWLSINPRRGKNEKA
jgi:hypothetical protein